MVVAVFKDVGESLVVSLEHAVKHFVLESGLQLPKDLRLLNHGSIVTKFMAIVSLNSAMNYVGQRMVLLGFIKLHNPEVNGLNLFCHLIAHSKVRNKPLERIDHITKYDNPHHLNHY